MNAQIGKDKNNRFCLYNLSYRNEEYLADFYHKKRRAHLITKFKKKRERKLWTYTNRNNSKAQLDYISRSKKWVNSAVNCAVYSSLEGVSVYQKIVTAKIRWSLRRNKRQIVKSTRYDWFSLTN